MRSVLCVPVCLCVCLSVCVSFCVQDYWKSNEPISSKLGVTIAPTNRKNWLTFGGAPVPDTDSGYCLFPVPLRNRGFWEIYKHFSYSHQTICTILGEMTDADNRINQLYFWSDPADNQIRIPINLETQIRIPDYFCFAWDFGLEVLAGVCALWTQKVTAETEKQ